MKLAGRFFALIAIALAMSSLGAGLLGSGLFGPSGDRQEAQAQLLDSNEYLCSNCFFGASTYYYCFEAGGKILIGYQKVPAMNWRDPSANLLTRAHKAWQPWVSEGQTVPLHYDEKYIWVKRPDGGQVRLKQDYNTDIFINNSQCRAAVRKK